MTDFIFLGSKITADGDCSHDIKTHVLLGRKAITNLDGILKSKDYFTDKGPYSQSYGFSRTHVQMWELNHKESWAPKYYAFELWCWRRLLRVPWTARRSNQFILKEISPGCSLEGLMLAETPILWPSDAKSWLIWKDPDAGKHEGGGRRGREDEMVEWHHWCNGHEFEQALGFGEVQGSLACILQSMGLQRLWHDWVAELNWNGSGVEGKKVVKILENHRCKKGKEVVRRWEKMLMHWQLSEWGTRRQRKRIAKVQMSKFRHSV